MSCSTDRYGALIDKKDPSPLLPFCCCYAQVLGRRIIKGKIGGPVQIGGCRETHKNRIGTFYDRFKISGKEEIFIERFLDDVGQTRFTDIFFYPFGFTAVKGVYLVRVIVIGIHFVAIFRTNSGMDKPYITGSYNDYFHSTLLRTLPAWQHFIDSHILYPQYRSSP